MYGIQKIFYVSYNGIRLSMNLSNLLPSRSIITHKRVIIRRLFKITQNSRDYFPIKALNINTLGRGVY